MNYLVQTRVGKKTFSKRERTLMTFVQKLLSQSAKKIAVFSAAALFIFHTPFSVASLSSKPATPSQLMSASAGKTAKVGASQKINQVYRKWAGVRYRLGGTSRSGIDCSAFVRETMSKAFNVSLPRSTVGQKVAGRRVSKSELRPGDLVFFRGNRHVGVYVGNGKFVHSGSSTGVTTASLSNSYWTRHYTQARRVM